jgi:hypothetical protein
MKRGFLEMAAWPFPVGATSNSEKPPVNARALLPLR